MDREQQQAINHFQGPALVIAGPGCGKTSIITHRLSVLVNQQNIDPSSIVAISFTKASSQELKARSLSISNNLSGVFYGTLHSFFLSLLKTNPIYQYLQIISKESQQQIISKILSQKIQSKYIPRDVVDMILSEFNSISNNLPVNNLPFNTSVKEIYDEYTIYKKKENLIDFDDILYKTHEFLNDSPKELHKFQRKYQYYIIDEFQDINEIQMKLLVLLNKVHQNIFVVGDEDQSIYGFRGSNPDFLVSFSSFFKSPTLYKVVKSYRCPDKILRLSNHLIKNNLSRHDKKIISQVQTHGNIYTSQFPSVLHQAKKIREIIQGNSLSYEKYMIIYRTNNEALPFIKEFSDHNIPFSVKDINNTILNHFIYKDIKAYLSLSLEKEDLLCKRNITFLNHIRNKPYRKIPKFNLPNTEENGWMDMKIHSLKINHHLKKIYTDIKKINLSNFQLAINNILYELRYIQYLEQYGMKYNIAFSELLDVVDSIQSLVPNEASVQEALKIFQDIRNAQNQFQNNKKQGQVGVLLSTAHGAKGLEKDHVFIISLNNGTFPHKRSLETGYFEEERRLLYVAITRSKKNLFLSYIHDNASEKHVPSLFISEMGIKKTNLN